MIPIERFFSLLSIAEKVISSDFHFDLSLMCFPLSFY